MEYCQWGQSRSVSSLIEESVLESPKLGLGSDHGTVPGGIVQNAVGIILRIVFWKVEAGLIDPFAANLAEGGVIIRRVDTGFQNQSILLLWRRSERAPAVGTEIVQSCYNGLTVGAAGGDGGIVCLLAQQQPVRGHAEQPAHLCQIGHVGVILARFPNIRIQNRS